MVAEKKDFEAAPSAAYSTKLLKESVESMKRTIAEEEEKRLEEAILEHNADSQNED